MSRMLASLPIPGIGPPTGTCALPGADRARDTAGKNCDQSGDGTHAPAAAPIATRRTNRLRPAATPMARRAARLSLAFALVGIAVCLAQPAAAQPTPIPAGA